MWRGGSKENKIGHGLIMIEAGLWVKVGRGGSSYYSVFFCVCLKICIVKFFKSGDKKELPLPLPLVIFASGEHMLPGINAAIL